MTCLLYGIVFSQSGAPGSGHPPPGLPPGVGGAPALHADRAVLPMRYGCLFEEERQVVELLAVHGQQYAAALRGLDGCVEMGGRVLLPTESSSPLPSFGSESGGASGRAYLTARAAGHARAEEVAGALAAVVARLRGGVGGAAAR